MVLPAPGKSPAATARRIFALSYDLWEERFAVTTVDARSQSVSHLMLAAAEAWCVEQLAVPVSALGALGRDLPFWIRLEYRILDGDAVGIGGLALHAAGAHRRVESPPQDRVIAACPRGRSVPAAAARLVLAAMTLRTRLIAAFLASTLLPLGATVWITTSLLDRSLRYATTGELDRLVADARDDREAVLPARTRRAERGRARGPDDARRPTRRRTRPSGPSRSDRSGRAVRPSASACRAPAASAWTTCGERTVPAASAWRRDLQP